MAPLSPPLRVPNSTRRPLHALLLVLLAVLVTACATAGPAGTSSSSEDSSELPAEQLALTAQPERLLRRARRADEPERSILLLRAAEGFLFADDPAGMAEALADTGPLPASERRRWQLLQAGLALYDDQPAAATALLRQAAAEADADAAAKGSEPAERGRLALELHLRLAARTNHHLAAAYAAMGLYDLVPAERQPALVAATWHHLSALPALARTAVFDPGTTVPSLAGWLDLVATLGNSDSQPDAWQQALERWLSRWPDHPAAIYLPPDLAGLAQLRSGRPQHLAILLPLSGPLAGAGAAVRDGLLAGYFHSSSEAYPVPRLTLLDTGAWPVTELYDRALDAGADLVIGPLSRDALIALNQHLLASAAANPTMAGAPAAQVPVLALNYLIHQDPAGGPAGGRLAPQLLQFGLGAEDEAIAAAERAWQDGHRRAMLLAPANDWGRRAADAFNNRWRDLGGSLPAQAEYSTVDSISAAVAGALEVSRSEARAARVERLVGADLAFQARRRQDLDLVLLLGDSTDARVLRPTLAYYFAGDLPVYATSHIQGDATGAAGASGAGDLDGVRFCDMPWRLAGDPLRSNLEQHLPAAIGPGAGLHAMGLDAWRLLPHLARLQAWPGARLFGATGNLYLGTGQQIHRDLLWGQMAENSSRPLPPASPW